MTLQSIGVSKGGAVIGVAFREIPQESFESEPFQPVLIESRESDSFITTSPPPTYLSSLALK
jgi:hypothetical protein